MQTAAIIRFHAPKGQRGKKKGNMKTVKINDEGIFLKLKLILNKNREI